jgi:hypothetical protein
MRADLPTLQTLHRTQSSSACTRADRSRSWGATTPLGRCRIVAAAFLVASCGGSSNESPPTADEVAAALARNPEFVRAVAASSTSALREELDAGVSDASAATADTSPSANLENLHAMAVCLSDVSMGNTNQRSVSPARLEACARVGLGTETLTVRQPAPPGRVAACYEACASLRGCARRVSESWCVRWAGTGGREATTGTTAPSISAECRSCRNEARAVTQNLGLEAPSDAAPTAP